MSAATRLKSAAHVVKAEDRLAPLHLHALVGRAGPHELLTIGDVPRGQRETHACGFLLARMNVLLVTHIRDDGDAHVRQDFHGVILRLAQLRPGTLARLGLDGLERRELNLKEGELALIPIVTPVADHVGEQRPVLISALGVRFALIPDGALDGVGNERRDHAVVKFRRTPGEAGLALGECLPVLLRGLPFRLPGHNRGVIPLLARVVSIQDVALETGIGFQHFLPHPDFSRRTTPRRVNHPHRHAEGLLQIAPEEIGDRREIRDRVRSANCPGAGHIIHRLFRLELGHRMKSQHRVGGLGNLQFGLVRVAHPPLHVRLAAGDPDLAHQHVAQRDGIFPRDLQLIRPAGFELLQFDGPLAVPGLGGDFLPAEFHRHHLALVRPAPDWHRGVTLQDHVIAEETVELHVRPRRGNGGKQRDDGKGTA